METDHKKQPPAFQFYASDFIGGTSHFSDAETGLYIRLLCAQWFDGGLPNDDEELLSYGKGNTRLDRVKSKFTLYPDGKLRHTKLEEVRQKQAEYRQLQSDKGKSGANARWHRPCPGHAPAIPSAMAQGMPKQWPEDGSPSPTPIVDAHKERAIPKLDAVLAFGQMRGLAKADCEHFWHHFEASGWVDKNGNQIVNWQSKLMTWKTQAQTGVSQKTNRKPFVSELKTVLEAKRALRDKIKNRGHEDALGWKARDEDDRKELSKLNKEIGQLTEQIAQAL